MTVTEGGYYTDPAGGGFEAETCGHKARRCKSGPAAHGIRGHGGGAAPQAGPRVWPFRRAKLRQYPGQRRHPPSNGDLAGAPVGSRISPTGSTTSAVFPTRWSTASYLRDRSKRDRDWQRTFGIDDRVPVTHENFRQWVIEDDFCAGRPDWDRVGATFSDRVHDYEAMKLRILNAGHQIIANPGEILSLETIADCMAHPLIHASFARSSRMRSHRHVDPVSRNDTRCLHRADRPSLLESCHRRHDPPRRL